MQALITQECQNGAVGPGALWPALAEAAAGVLPNIERLVSSARAARIPVIHCLVGKRHDLRGSNANAPLYRPATKPGRLELGTPATRLLDALDGEPSDIVLWRIHGVSPMSSTGLDAILRNLGVDEIVVCGVSVNVAIWSMTMDAVNASYRVTIPRDAVAGVPPDYASRVVESSLSLLATLTTTDELCRTWEED
jgi:nicotinamidase-related amidase